jgi:hypothetical protein
MDDPLSSGALQEMRSMNRDPADGAVHARNLLRREMNEVITIASRQEKMLNTDES